MHEGFYSYSQNVQGNSVEEHGQGRVKEYRLLKVYSETI